MQVCNKMNFLFFLFTSVRVRNKKNIDLNLFYSYVVFTNARVGIIRSRIFTGARVRNIASKPSEHKLINV
jgi:hypothetical protein